ncbi:MAG: hypothetical protein M0Z55_10045 [Peptococcaceae bacterium]|nr:hypothetical protein [Peptococcaceae bacterium]
MSNDRNLEFATLDQAQLGDLKRIEQEINSSAGDSAQEIILLAYAKPNNQ